MMYLFFDTETTGIPRKHKGVRLVQLAWILQSGDEATLGQTLGHGNFIIRPEGWEIPEPAAKVHGITTAVALAKGVPLGEVMSAFTAFCYFPGDLVAHNIAFDDDVLDIEYTNLQWDNPCKEKRHLCTMQASTDFCKLPRRWPGGYKWPKLFELHQALFNTGFEGAHNALADVRALSKCFWEMRKRGLI